MPGAATFRGLVSVTVFWKFNWCGSPTNALFCLLLKLKINPFSITNRSFNIEMNKTTQCFSQTFPMDGKDKTDWFYELSETGDGLKCSGKCRPEKVSFRGRDLKCDVASRDLHVVRCGAWLLVSVPCGAAHDLWGSSWGGGAVFAWTSLIRFVVLSLVLEFNLFSQLLENSLLTFTMCEVHSRHDFPRLVIFSWQKWQFIVLSSHLRRTHVFYKGNSAGHTVCGLLPMPPAQQEQ